MHEIVFATNNYNKVKEVQNMIGKDFQILNLKDLGLGNIDIPEEQDTLKGNALQKANFIYKRFSIPCFADDTGLEINALDGKPGVYSARYAQNDVKNSSQPVTDANVNKVLRNLENKKDRTARFKTVIAYIENNNKYFFDGVVSGTITIARKGKDGFGYDPVFQPDGHDKTYAQMTLEEKNLMSHRAIAFRKFAGFLLSETNYISE